MPLEVRDCVAGGSDRSDRIADIDGRRIVFVRWVERRGGLGCREMYSVELSSVGSCVFLVSLDTYWAG